MADLLADGAEAGRGVCGRETYASFVREIESIRVHGDTAIDMGSETVMPKDNSPDAGTTIRRHYTNVWMKRDEKWRLTARHANVVNSNGELLRQETLSITEEDIDGESVMTLAVAEEERLRTTEREHLRALVDADMAVTRRHFPQRCRRI